jgi:hypothetical protein
MIALLALASCAAPGARRELAEPITVEDLQALPSEVNAENARAVARQCLQTHRRSATNVHERYGYAFRERGFVQLASFQQSPERVSRVYVDFAAVQAARSEVFVDTALFRHRVRVELSGPFRRWESVVSPFRAQPDLDAEPATHPIDGLVIVFDNADAATQLIKALQLLSGKPR